MGGPAGGQVESRLVHEAAGTVRCHTEAGHVTISVGGSLDRETADALVDAVTDELTANPNRVDVDLRQVESFVVPGAQALGRCRDLCATVPAGLHFRIEGGPGQSALLEAFASEPPSNPG
jgi:hypothetical protein